MSNIQAYFLTKGTFCSLDLNAVAEEMKHPVKVVSNKSTLPTDPNILCIRWGCTSTIPQKKVVNKSSAIHEVFDKPSFRRKLYKQGLAPRLFGPTEIVEEENLPVIVRPDKHTQGQHAYKCDSLSQLYSAVCKASAASPTGSYYISEYIDKVEEYRVFVVQGRVVFMCRKIPKSINEVAWDFSDESLWQNTRWGKWPEAVCKIAIEAMSLTELTCGGVDVIVDKQGKPYVLEINSASGFYGFYMVSCAAAAFDYILEKGKDNITVPLNKKTSWPYLKYIHPAIEPKAYIND
mgnify:CR=1 FL=1